MYEGERMKHTIYQGDCIKIMKKLPDESVDLIVTDPPYNIGVDYGKNKDKNKDYFKWCFKWLKECERVLKNNGSIYIINYPENNSRIMNELSKTNMIFRNWIVWHYPSNIGHSKTNFTRASRSILFYTKGNKFKFNLDEGEVVEDVLEFNLVKNVSKEKVPNFPNQIPEKLVEILMEISSNEKDVVLDCFLGSGTTGVVALKLNRQFIGIELNPEFVTIAKKRMKPYIGQMDLEGNKTTLEVIE